VTATKSLYSASPLSLFLNKFVYIKEDLWLVKLLAYELMYLHWYWLSQYFNQFLVRLYCIFISKIYLLSAANMFMLHLFHAGAFISENCSVLLILERKSASNSLLVQR
jgi:hypothetical protein